MIWWPIVGMAVGLIAAENLDNQQVEAVLERRIKDYNLPKNLGNGVTWTHAQVLRRGLRYYYVINKTLKELDESHNPYDFKRTMLKVMKPLYCHSEEMKFLRDHKVALDTQYYSKDGLLYDNIRITASYCTFTDSACEA